MTLSCSLGRCCSIGSPNTEALEWIERRASDIDDLVAAANLPNALDSRWSIYMDAAFYVADFVILDLVAIVNYVVTKNYMFAAVASVVYARSMYVFANVGGLRGLYREVQASVNRGLMTDVLLETFLDEKIGEAIPSMSLQYYSLMFVSFSEFALISGLVSMAFSTRAVVSGAYVSIHLGVL